MPLITDSFSKTAQDHPFIGLKNGKLLLQNSTVITLDTTSTANTNPDSATLAWSHTVNAGSNAYLIVGIGLRGNRTVNTVTFGAQSLTKIISYNPESDVRCEMWGLANPTASTNTITIAAASSGTTSAGASSWFGVGSLGNRDGWGSISISSNPSYSVVSDTGNVLIGTISGQSTSAITPGQNLLWNVTGTANHTASNYVAGNQGATTLSYTIGNFFAWTVVELVPLKTNFVDSTTPSDAAFNIPPILINKTDFTSPSDSLNTQVLPKNISVIDGTNNVGNFSAVQDHPFIGLKNGRLTPVNSTQIILDSTSSSATNPDSNTLAWNHTINSGANTFLLVSVGIRGNTAINSVTFGIQSLTKLNSYAPAQDIRVEVWYLLNPTVSTNTITVTAAGTATISAGASSWFGVGSIGNIDQWGSIYFSLDSSIPFISDTGNVVVGSISAQSIITITPGQTILWQQSGTSNYTASNYIAGNQGLTTLTYSFTSDDVFAWSLCELIPVERSLYDTTTPSDTNRLIVRDSIKITDTSTPAESVTVFIPGNKVSVSDSTTPNGDVETEVIGNFISLSDTTTPNGDTEFELIGNYITVSDSTAPNGDSEIEVIGNNVSITDSTTPDDTNFNLTLTTPISNVSITALDTTMPNDTDPIVLIPKNYISVTDSTTPSDIKTVFIPNNFVSVSDNSTPTDNQTVFIPTNKVDVSDSSTPSDSLSILIPKLNLSLTDSSAPVDSQTVFIPSNYISITDSTSPSDVSTLLIPKNYVSLTDSSTPTDSLSVLIPSEYVSITDSTTPTDSVSVFIPTQKISVSDATTPVDSFGFFFNPLDIIINEGTSVTDSFSLIVGSNAVSITETTIPTDTIILLIPKNYISISDNTTPSDLSEVLIPNLIVRITDSTLPADSISVSILNLNISIVNSSTPTDSVSVSTGGLSISITENTAPTDSLNIFTPTLKINISDSSTPTDSVGLFTPILSIIVLDSSAATDTSTTKIIIPAPADFGYIIDLGNGIGYLL